jgi:predicted SAM-dependent methyltransferase
VYKITQIFLKYLLRNFLYIFRKLYYSGNNIHCCICKKTFRRMISYGASNFAIKKYKIFSMGPRKNCICPNCYSKDRERLVFLFLRHLQKNYLLQNNTKILHFSPERSLKDYFFKGKFKNYYTANLKGKNIDFQIDLSKKIEIDDKFDLIICNHVLEHIHNDIFALGNIYTMLSDNGMAILQTPYSKIIDQDYFIEKNLSPEENLKFYGQNDHVRIYSKKALINKIKNTGFELKVYKSNYFNSDKCNYGLIEEEEVLFAKKQKN